MKKFVSFVLAMCMIVSLSGVCFAADPMAEASGKFNSLSQEEKENIYELSDKAIESITELLNEYAAHDIIDAATYDMVINYLEAHLEEAKENGQLPIFIPPLSSCPQKDKVSYKISL